VHASGVWNAGIGVTMSNSELLTGRFGASRHSTVVPCRQFNYARRQGACVGCVRTPQIKCKIKNTDTVHNALCVEERFTFYKKTPPSISFPAYGPGSTPCRRCRRSSSPPLGLRSVTGRSINSARDTRRPRLSCGCGQSMERPSANDQGLTVAADVPPTT